MNVEIIIHFKSKLANANKLIHKDNYGGGGGSCTVLSSYMKRAITGLDGDVLFCLVFLFFLSLFCS